MSDVSSLFNDIIGIGAERGGDVRSQKSLIAVSSALK